MNQDESIINFVDAQVVTEPADDATRGSVRGAEREDTGHEEVHCPPTPAAGPTHPAPHAEARLGAAWDALAVNVSASQNQ